MPWGFVAKPATVGQQLVLDVPPPPNSSVSGGAPAPHRTLNQSIFGRFRLEGLKPERRGSMSYGGDRPVSVSLSLSLSLALSLSLYLYLYLHEYL